MIVCIECSGRGYDSQIAQYSYLFPVGECRKCHRNMPLMEGYVRRLPGKLFDCQGNEIAVGDTIAVSLSAGHGSGRMIIGTIVKITVDKVFFEYETIDYVSGKYDSKEIMTKKTYFNYGASKCLKLNSSNV